MSQDSLINKWRPRNFDEVVGHHEVVKSFMAALDDRTSHAFLFTGPSGIGKTSLARLGAEYIGTTAANLIDVDAATYSGKDDMRSLTESLAYRPLGRNSTKSVIVDEAHAVTKPAWQTLLKKVEEPPDWVMWFFCTTEVDKVPATIKTRCNVYALKPLRVNELIDYLKDVAGAEKFTTQNSIIELCAKMAEGSPRSALSNLSVCYTAKDRAEAAKLIADAEVESGAAPFELARAIADGASWDRIQPLLKSLSESAEAPETVRHVVRAYFTSAMLGSKDQKAACFALKVLDCFSEPFNPVDGYTPLAIAVGRVLFSV